MSALTDRLYLAWRLANGAGYGAAPHVGAQRRNRPEGYPKDQTRSPEGRRPEVRAGADPQGGGVLTRSDAGRDASNAQGGGCVP